MRIKISPKDFMDYVSNIMLLSLFEKDNPNFLLNENKNWKDLIEFIAQKTSRLKIDLLKQFLMMNPLKKNRFRRLKNILYKKKTGSFEFYIVNSTDKIQEEKEESQKFINQLIKNTVKETLIILNNKNNVDEKIINKISTDIINKNKINSLK